jgi:amino acid adenylation domain-containing protein
VADTLREEVVIIGMAGRFPGAGSVGELWNNLCDGVESIRRLSPAELAAAGIDGANPAPAGFVPAAAPLDEAQAFDASFFGYTPRDAALMDPQHRVFLECAWSALEDAGYDPAACPQPVGLFGGVAPNTYRQQVLETRPDILGTAGRYPLLLAGEREYAITRTAFKLGLKGPAVAVGTACSTSGVALHLACQSVLSGECDMALAGGARVAVPLAAGYVYEEEGILSPDGHCRAFDADARGTVVGSGVAIVVVKRMSDALRDGDTIRAIVKGTAINNDGADKIGFTAPGVLGQEAVIRQALEMAEVDASTIGYVEAHGTGTFLGDPIEVEALTRAFRADTDAVGFCGIGSIKTNIGHLDAGAGVAGVIKAVLALETGEIPPSLNFRVPNPQIDLAAGPFRVIDRLTQWPNGDSPRRAAVSSFGLGGTNAHVVLEQPPVADPSPASRRDHQLFVTSGSTEQALDRVTRALAEHLEHEGDAGPADVAYTLAVGRRHHPWRRSVVARDCREAAEKLHAAAGHSPAGAIASDRPAVFMFPGGGAQHVGMGERLYATEPTFRRAFDRCADLSERKLGADLRRLVHGGGDAATLERPAAALLALFATEYATARLLESLAVRPSLMIGHSLGEYAAACLAGVMSLEDTIALIALRGRLFEELPPGAMISVRLPAADLERRCGDDLSIAAVNEPDLCTVAGGEQAIAGLTRSLEQDGVETRPLRIAVAAHSHLVEPILDRFGEFAATIEFAEPEIAFISNLTGLEVGPGEVTRAEYWVAHLRKTVRFVDGLATALGGRPKLAVEVGPGQVLSGFARRHPARADGQLVVPALPHPAENTTDDAFLLAAVGKLWAAGLPVQLDALYANERRRRVPLPSYPFEREHHWIERGERRPVEQSPPVNEAADRPEALVEEPEPAGPAPPDRRSYIRRRVLDEFSQLSGVAPDELDTRAGFLELGFDSLFMTQAASAIGAAFGTTISFRRLLMEAPTLDALTDWLDERVSEQQLPAPVVEEASPAQGPEPASDGAPQGLEQIAAQLAAIQRQVAALSGEQPSDGPAIDVGSVQPSPVAPVPQDAELSGPWRPPETRGHDLDPEQLRYVRELTERLTARTGGSKAATAANRAHLADPRTAAGFRRTWKEIVYPIVADRSAGSKLWDVDGNEYVDVAMGFGVNLFGHSPPFVMEAVRAQLERGIEIGPQTPLAGETAALIAELTGHERVAFCNTGSEAVLAAMRLARTVTGRSKVVTFAHDYHGLFDEVLARGVTRDGQRRSLPIAPGIPAHAAQDLIIFDYGDPEALRYVAERGSELAAVLVEPVQSRHPEVRPVEFLRELRRTTADADVALVFDEMITGFRSHPGGVQALFGVQADLATYGKVLGGGFPIGVVAGTARFMDALDGGAWRYGDDSIPEADVTWFAGTFVRHPVALAASRAVLEHLKAAGPGLQADLNARTTRFVRGLNEYLEELDVAIRIEHFSSLFLTRFRRDQQFASLFYFHLRDHGVHITEGRGAFLSTAHTEADLALLDSAYRAAASSMKSAGFLSAAHKEAEGRRTAAAEPKPRELAVTEGQQEILLAASMSSEANCAYNLANTLHITGPLDEAALRRAVRRVVDRHQSLRVTFSQDLTRQRIVQAETLGVNIVDLSELEPEACDAALAERRTVEVETPFDLHAGPLVRVTLVRMAEDEHHLFVTVHHAICDGWSSGTLLRHIVEEYSAERGAAAVSASPPAMQLEEYVDWLGRYLESETRAADERFWAEYVAGDFPATELPADRPRAASKSYGAQRREVCLDGQLVADLRRRAAEENSTLFALLLASFECLLGRLTDRSEVALGLTIAGHTQFPRRDLVAHCANLLPLRRKLDSDATFSAHLATTQTAILDAFEHQNLSYGAIVRGSGVRRDRSRTPLVTVTFNMDSPSDPLDMHGATAMPGSSPRHFENFDLFLNVVPRSEELVLEATFNTDLFDPATVDGWLARYEALLREMLAGAGSTIGELGAGEDADRSAIAPAVLPLTEPQAEILTAAATSRGANCSFNRCVALTLEGPLHLDSLQAAVDTALARHDALRAVLGADARTQTIKPPFQLPLPLHDLSHIAADARDRAIDELLEAECDTPFDLLAGPLVRAFVVRESPERHVFVLTAHDIVCDARSSATLIADLGQLYAAHRAGVAMREPAASYADQVTAQAEPRALAVAAADAQYWAAQYADGAPVLDLPRAGARPSTRTYRGGSESLTIGKELLRALAKAAEGSGATLAAVMLAGYETLLHRLSGQSDLVVGIPLADGDAEADRALVAHRLNIVPLRARLNGACAFSEHVRDVRDRLKEARQHPRSTPGALARRLDVPADERGTSLIQATFSFEELGVRSGFGDLVAAAVAMPRRYLEHELELNVLDSGEYAIVECHYDADLFDGGTVRRWLSHYETLLGAAAAKPEIALEAVPVLNRDDERAILDEFNDTRADLPAEKRLHRLFELQVRRTPDADAVVDGSTRVSYAELNARANRLAHRLRRAGIGPGAAVGICLERRVDLVVALLAALKAGGAYVPLDPAYPHDRLAFMLKDSQARAVITQADLVGLLDGSGAERIVVDADARSIAAEPATDLEGGGAEQTDLAYVIYTSGSTGVPKGVAVEHRSAGTLLHWARTVFSDQDISGLLASTSVCFDLSVFEIFLPLAFGGSLILAGSALEVASIVARDEVSLLNTVPSAAAEIVRAGALPRSVETVVLCGEPLPTRLVDQIYATGHVQRVFDIYGPTEDTVYSTFALREPGAPATIGRPISNTRAYVLDRRREPVPIGAVGELYLAGDGLARGYLNRPELTAERFVSVSFGGRPAERAYVTGDLARYRPDGALEFLGRTDGQVKLRGFRIELGEIEATIAKEAQVEDVVVQAREDRPGDKRLVAYVAAPDAGGLVDRLKSRLRQTLPEYMVPAHFVLLAALPRLPNGKIDRGALPEPDYGAQQIGGTHTAPRTATETRIAAIWAEALGSAHFGVEDDFFELGGHSLMAAHVVVAVRQALGVDLAMRHLFEHPTVAELARKVDVLAVAADGAGGQATGEREEIEI